MAPTLLPLPSESDLKLLHSSPEAFESAHVHAIYDSIASHFSQTRYKPWPIISAFLSSLPPHALGLDAGCGNGKYLPLVDASGGLLLGLDRSQNLLLHARKQPGALDPRPVVLADALAMGVREGVFDYAISIATIHHLSTPRRRLAAVRALLRAVKPDGGRVLVYVWAAEQGEGSRRVVPEQEGRDEGKIGVDVWVPWVMVAQGKGKEAKKGEGRKREKGGGRRQHTEASETPAAAPPSAPAPSAAPQPRAPSSDPQPSAPVQAPEHTPVGQPFSSAPQPTSSPYVPSSQPTTASPQPAPQSYNRYYHLFSRGELLALCLAAASAEGLRIHVVQEGWERDNWFAEVRVVGQEMKGRRDREKGGGGDVCV